MRPGNKRTVPLIIISVVLLLLTAYDYGYRNFLGSMSEIKESRSIKEKTLNKYNSMIAQKGGLENELNDLKEKLGNEEDRLPEWQGPALAAANLQNIVKDVVSSNGGNITTERVNKAETRGNYKVVSIGMDMVVQDTSVLTSILFGIESQSPYIKITNLDIRVNDLKSPRELTVRLDIAAMMKGKQ